MTPLAMKLANQLALPVKRRTFHNQRILSLLEGDVHCFEVSAIAQHIGDAMDEENVWPEVAHMLPDLFLPAPITWVEGVIGNGCRVAYAMSRDDDWWYLDMVIDGAAVVGGPIAKFRGCSLLCSPERVEVLRIEDGNPMEPLLREGKNAEPSTANTAALSHLALEHRLIGSPHAYAGHKSADYLSFVRGRKNVLELEKDHISKGLAEAETELELLRMAKTGIGFAVLAIDLINTPGVVGFRQHAPHSGLARKLAHQGVGKYPLRAWSEVTVKTHTVFDDGDYSSGETFRKCLHFVRSHHRHYRDGRRSIVRAHWRGDPALGIKRTRYRVMA